MNPKYPEITVNLTGVDGNAFSIIGKCRTQAKRKGISNEELEKFQKECMSGDYDNLLQTCMKWFNIV